jgi:hypothetical protein
MWEYIKTQKIYKKYKSNQLSYSETQLLEGDCLLHSINAPSRSSQDDGASTILFTRSTNLVGLHSWGAFGSLKPFLISLAPDLVGHGCANATCEPYYAIRLVAHIYVSCSYRDCWTNYLAACSAATNATNLLFGGLHNGCCGNLFSM